MEKCLKEHLRRNPYRNMRFCNNMNEPLDKSWEEFLTILKYWKNILIKSIRFKEFLEKNPVGHIVKISQRNPRNPSR